MLTKSYLKQSSAQWKVDFMAQNTSEWASGNIPALAIKLANLSRQSHVKCISGSKGDFVFFNSGACKAFFWNEREQINSLNHEGLTVKVIFQLPKNIQILVVLMVLAQFSAFFIVFILIKKLEKKKFEMESLQLKHEASLGSLLVQVAHDMRSPLAALKYLTTMSPEDEGFKEMLELSVNRLFDIADDLLDKNRKKPIYFKVNGEIEKIVSEKKLLFNGLGITIETHLENSFNTSVFAHKETFMRILSNLLNNAQEAILGVNKPSIKIKSEIKNNLVQIYIQDNGSGMPEEVIKNLGRKGNTFGKKMGSGLGLAHAVNEIKEMGGSFKIESSKTHTTLKGTRIILELPIVN